MQGTRQENPHKWNNCSHEFTKKRLVFLMYCVKYQHQLVETINIFNDFDEPTLRMMIEESSKSESYKKYRQKTKVAKLRSQFSELELTKQQLISKHATKSDDGKPIEGGNELQAGIIFGGRS